MPRGLWGPQARRHRGRCDAGLYGAVELHLPRGAKQSGVGARRSGTRPHSLYSRASPGSLVGSHRCRGTLWGPPSAAECSGANAHERPRHVGNNLRGSGDRAVCHTRIRDNTEEVGNCGGLAGNLMFLPSTSMQDKLASILEIPRSSDDDPS
ncbi:hypothetical protein GWK47_004675 [Chionoecetes opilio]|uniref:Uncharacterized protein n=1 Tax=Chionoecetes opilio TaxID=41210 RepID=A0A8J5CM02_CHIOP|nr:hypothetical protein GWK47_004675 [Chionoecetes opilio]